MGSEDSQLTLNNNDFPFEIKPVEKKLNDLIMKDFDGERTGYVQVGEEKWFFPQKFVEASKYCYNFTVRPEDTWIVTFPRSGTTWTQELLWLLANDLDYEAAAKTALIDRFPFLEFSMFVHDDLKQEFLKENADYPVKQSLVEVASGPCWEELNKKMSPRFIKTHLPFSLLPPTLLTSGCKVIYVARNPKDVAVSFYHLSRLIRTQGYSGDFPKYWDYFQNNLQPWTPYWSHIKEGWKYKDHPNVKFLFYEDINRDLPAAIKTLSEFLNKSYSDEQVTELRKHLSIENFRKNSSVNFDILKDLGILKTGEQSFIRKGKTGGWSDEFTPEINRKADQWIAENLKNTDMRFPSL